MASQTVFISYASEDRDFAEQLQSELETRLKKSGKDERVWRDKTALNLGDNWRESIDEGISASDSVIVILSKKSSASPYVTYEWAYAQGQGKNVVPVLLETCKKHPKLESLQHLDFSRPEDRDWDALMSAVSRRPRVRGIFLEKWPRTYEKDLEDAQQLLFVGVSLRDILKRLGHSLKRKLDRDKNHRLRFLISEPMLAIVTTAAARTGTAPEAKLAEINEAQRRLLELRNEHPRRVELKTTDYPLSYGICAVDPPSDPEGTGGPLYIKLYPYRAASLEKPRFVLGSGDPWYGSFQRELTELWKAGKVIPPMPSQSRNE